jgi:radical SAM enzyme (TIGR01210 family)
VATSYPELGRDRDAWILERRGRRNSVDARRPYAFVLEQELSDAREVVPVATLFLTNRECPWRCLMCDLWRNTLAETVPIGAIPEQIDFALAQLGSARVIKLYNSGSFFDVRAIPSEDYGPIADRVSRFDRVIVECHPALLGKSVFRFRDMLAGKLEVAMGLETAHPQTLARLNKRMTVEQFGAASEVLRRNGVALRVFVLVKPPFQTDEEAWEGCRRSIEFAFSCGATVVSLIPTRGGNGALQALAQQGEFRPPRLELLEAAVEYGIHLGHGRVFADLWDLEKFSTCSHCFARRAERLGRINLTQQLEPPVTCALCDGLKNRPGALPV